MSVIKDADPDFLGADDAFGDTSAEDKAEIKHLDELVNKHLMRIKEL